MSPIQLAAIRERIQRSPRERQLALAEFCLRCVGIALLLRRAIQHGEMAGETEAVRDYCETLERDIRAQFVCLFGHDIIGPEPEPRSGVAGSIGPKPTPWPHEHATPAGYDCNTSNKA